MECCRCFQSKNSPSQSRNKTKVRGSIRKPQVNENGRLSTNAPENKRPISTLSQYQQQGTSGVGADVGLTVGVRQLTSLSKQQQQQLQNLDDVNEVYYQNRASARDNYQFNNNQHLQMVGSISKLNINHDSGRIRNNSSIRNISFQKQSPQRQAEQIRGAQDASRFENKPTHLTMVSMRNNITATGGYLSRGEDSMLMQDDNNQNKTYSFYQQNNEIRKQNESNLDRLFTLPNVIQQLGTSSQEDRTANLDFENDSYADYNSQNGGNQLINFYAIKSFKYFCSQCQKPFQKLLITDFKSHPEKPYNIVVLNDQFCTLDNHDCICPFCQQTVTLILNSNLWVGTQDQMEQFDLMCNGDNLHLMENEYDCQATIKEIPKTKRGVLQQKLNKNFAVANDASQIINNQQQHQQYQNNHTLSAQLSEYNEKSQTDPIIHKNDIDTQSQMSQLMTQASSKTQNVLFKHKFQKLKNSSKYAQMLIVGEIPINYSKFLQTNKSTMFQTNPDLTDDPTSFKEASPNEGMRNSPKIFQSQLNLKDYQQHKSQQNQMQNQYINQQQILQKYMPPDLLHQASRSQCKQFNKDIMRSLINAKMSKNKTYLEQRQFDEKQANKKQMKINNYNNRQSHILVPENQNPNNQVNNKNNFFGVDNKRISQALF
eukprot:403333975